MTELVRFGAICPACGHQPRQGFTPSEAQQLLEVDELKFYCAACGHHWRPMGAEVDRLERWIEDRAHRRDP